MRDGGMLVNISSWSIRSMLQFYCRISLYISFLLGEFPVRIAAVYWPTTGMDQIVPGAYGMVQQHNMWWSAWRAISIGSFWVTTIVGLDGQRSREWH
eukprot:1208793-Amphidinium_carterae.2